MVLWLLLASDFWTRVAPTSADASLAEGTRLLGQAQLACPAGCREGSAGFLAQQTLYRQAAQSFIRAASLRPEDADPPFFAAQALREVQDWDGALAQFEEARRRRPDGPRAFDIAFYSGTVHAHAGRFQRSVDEYMRALPLSENPHDSAILYINSAESTMAMGRLADAIKLYRRGIEVGELALRAQLMTPSSQAGHLLGLAVALDRDEQVEKGLAAVRRAIELDGSLGHLRDPGVFFVPDGDAAYYEALVELARGNRTEAAHAFVNFLRLLPQSPFAARARAHLKDLGVAAPKPVVDGPIGVQGGVIHATGLTAPEVQAALEHQFDAIGHCMAGLGQPWRIEIRVDKRGSVDRISTAPTDEGVTNCLRPLARSWRFRRGGEFVLKLRVRP